MQIVHLTTLHSTDVESGEGKLHLFGDLGVFF
jgi:hypothetical protein